MSTDVGQSNSMSPRSGARSSAAGEMPEAVRRRYYREGRGGDLSFYEDASMRTPAFRDRGVLLTTARSTPQVVKDLATVARHRGWTVVRVSGSRIFRREAWLASRELGLEVIGYRPTERDVEALARRRERQERRLEGGSRSPAQQGSLDARLAKMQAAQRVGLIERTLTRALSDPAARERVLEAARLRVGEWLARNATFAQDLDRARERGEMRQAVRDRSR